MSNYAPRLAQDKNGVPMQEFASPKLALNRYTSENGTASSVISVGHNTTALEVAAVGGAAALRWVGTADTEASIITIAGATANFDHIIPSGTVRRFVIPIATNPQTGSVQGVNREIGLYQRVAIKSMGIASVLLAEF